MSQHKQLAKIIDFRFGISNGMLAFGIRLLKEDGIERTFGEYQMDNYDKDLKRMVGTASGMDMILRVLQVFNVAELSYLEGKMCYILLNSDGDVVGLKALNMNGGDQFLVSDWQKQWFD